MSPLFSTFQYGLESFTFVSATSQNIKKFKNTNKMKEYYIGWFSGTYCGLLGHTTYIYIIKILENAQKIQVLSLV